MDKSVSKNCGAVDSGNRTELVDGGGLRDICPQNGRCDLMPLNILSDVIDLTNYIAREALIEYSEMNEHQAVSRILGLIDGYIYNGNPNLLLESVLIFVFQNYQTNSMSESNFDDVLSATFSSALLDLSHRYREGAEKYAERNWEKGIPIKSFVDSGVRHLLKWYRKDTDENHASAFVWNMVGALWTQRHKPKFMGEMPFCSNKPTKTNTKK